MTQAPAHTPTRRPAAVLIVALLLTLLSIALVFRMRPETSIQGLLDPGAPAVQAMGSVLERFPVTEELLVLVSVPDDEATPDPARLLAFAQRLETSIASDADARGLVSTFRYRPPPEMRAYVEQVIIPGAFYYLDDAQSRLALARLTRAWMDEQFARNRAMLAVPGPAAGNLGKAMIRDPLRLHEFLLERLTAIGPASIGGNPGDDAFYSPDRRGLLIRISGTRPPNDLEFCSRITATLGRLITHANTERLQVDIAGAYAVAAHNAAAIRSDSIIGVNTSIVGMALLFWLVYRRPVRLFLFAFVPMTVGIVWGFGAFAATHASFTPLAAVVGGALGGIGIDYFVFFLAHYDGRRRTAGETAAEIAAATLTQLRRPLLAAFLTSVIGCVAIAWSPIRVLRDFAVLATLALLGAYLASITLLPAALSLFDRQTQRGVVGRPVSRSNSRIHFTRPLGLTIARRAGWLLGAMACLVIAALVYLTTADRSATAPASDLMMLHPHPNPPLEAQRRVSTRMGIAQGTLQLYLRADSPSELLKLAHEVDRRLKRPELASAGLRGVLGLASLLPDPATSTMRRQQLDPRLPERVGPDLHAAATAAGFNPAGFVPYATFLERLVSPGPAPDMAALARYPAMAQLVMSRETMASVTRDPAEAGPADAMTLVFFDNALDVRERRDAALAALHSALDDLGDRVTITGMAAISAHVESVVRRDLPMLIGIALGGIALCLAVHFRSLRLGLLAVTPTVVSMIIVFTVMTITHRPLNLVNMVMIPLLLGIDVDYGVMTVSAWQRARSRAALVRSFPLICSAVITCGATTIIGFGSLVTTSIPAVQSLGWLINIGVISCLLGSTCVLWPILFLLRTPAHPPHP